jgi:molybdate transport system ATP-binding protein
MKDRLAMLLHAVSVRRGDKWVLRDVCWRLQAGERWALIGDNGAGKTQLLKLLSGAVWPTPGTRRRLRGGGPEGRSYLADGRPVELIDAKRRIAYLGAEQQDKYARYGWNLRVRDLVATGLHRSDLLLMPVTPRQAREVAASLRMCGLQRHAAREFLSLSYGQKRLALLARALVQDPDWLLLDELYNGLDAGYRRRIDTVLEAAARRGQSWVATAHRAADVPPGTRRMLELAAGRVRAVKSIRAADLARLVRRAGENAHDRPRARRSVAGVENGDSPMLIRLSQVDLYVEYRPVLRDLDWTLRQGEHWAVYGANGAGKSSFLKLLYGDLSPALGGTIERAGFPRGSLSGNGGWATFRRSCRATMRWTSLCWIWWRAVDTRASASSMRLRRRIAGLQRVGSDSSACRRPPGAGRANCRMGSCAARSSRAPWRPMRASCCWMSR